MSRWEGGVVAARGGVCVVGGVGEGVAGGFGPDGVGVRVVAVVGIRGIVVGECGMLDA